MVAILVRLLVSPRQCSVAALLSSWNGHLIYPCVLESVSPTGASETIERLILESLGIGNEKASK